MRGDVGLHKDVDYLCWPIAPSYMSPNARGGGGVACSQPMSTAVHRSPNKLWRSNSMFNLWPISSPHSVHGRGVQPGHRHTGRHHAWATGADPGTTKSVLWIRIHWIRMRIRIQHFKWTRIRIWIRFKFGSRVLMTQNWRNKMQLKISSFFLIKIAICWSLGFYKGRPSYRISLHPSKENILHFKRRNLLTIVIVYCHICPVCVRNWIADPDPDPGTPLNLDLGTLLNPDLIRIRIHNTA